MALTWSRTLFLSIRDWRELIENYPSLEICVSAQVARKAASKGADENGDELIDEFLYANPGNDAGATPAMPIPQQRPFAKEGMEQRMQRVEAKLDRLLSHLDKKPPPVDVGLGASRVLCHD